MKRLRKDLISKKSSGTGRRSLRERRPPRFSPKKILEHLKSLSSIRSVEERLARLAASEIYGSDFGMVRRQLSKISAWAKPGDKDPLKGFLFRDRRGKVVSGSGMKNLFEEGNVNLRMIRTKGFGDLLSDRYGLEFYFDPDKPHPEGFDPFKDPRDRIRVPDNLTAKEIAREVARRRGPVKKRKTPPRFPEDVVHQIAEAKRKGRKAIRAFKDIFRLPSWDVDRNYRRKIRRDRTNEEDAIYSDYRKFLRQWNNLP